jgi:RNA polymerase sigma-70 factor (ECF subfamily)
MIEAEAISAATVPTAEELARQYASQVHRFAAMVCRNPAESEDLAQEALLKAMRALRKYDPRRGSIDAWLWRIVVNVARDAGRAATRADALWERLASMEHPHGAAEAAETEALRNLSDAELLDQVRRLPRREQTLIALRFGAQLTFDEMGDLLAARPATLRQAVHRSLRRLRVQLEDL